MGGEVRVERGWVGDSGAGGGRRWVADKGRGEGKKVGGDKKQEASWAVPKPAAP
jgi:hypothetical protein